MQTFFHDKFDMEINSKKYWKMQVLWGRQHGVVFVPSDGKLFIERDDIIILSMPADSTVKEKIEFLKSELKNQLQKEIEVLMPKWEQITGLHCQSWFIGRSHTCWGWCRPTDGRIMLNENLIYKPKQCLEYVILHELCHLDQSNHGKLFAELLNKYMPDWRDCEVLNNGRIAEYGKWK